jgi:hypothetical protein
MLIAEITVRFHYTVVCGGIRMADKWITRMSHYDYRDDEVWKIPKEAKRLATYFGSILRETLQRVPMMPPSTGLQCRRRPQHVRCHGYIHSELLSGGAEVRWWCPECGDNGYIYDWEGTRWDPKKSEPISGCLYGVQADTAHNSSVVAESTAPDLYEIVDGNIDCDQNTDGMIPKIVARDKEYTWAELGRELMTYEGFRVHITVHDDTE